MSSTLGYLRLYVQENPQAPLEDILNDEDFLEELHIKDESFITYLVSHLTTISEYILHMPTVMSDYKSAFKYPYLACEILATSSNLVREKLFMKEDQRNPIIIDLILMLTNPGTTDAINNSPMPGYVEKIISAHFKDCSEDMLKILEINFNIIIPSLMSNVENDSVRDILFQIIFHLNKRSLNPNEEYDKLRNSLIDEIFPTIHRLYLQQSEPICTYPNDCTTIVVSTGIILDKIRNLFWLLIKLIKTLFISPQCEIILLKIISKENLEMLESIIMEKSQWKMSDENVILDELDRKKIEVIYSFYSNLIGATLLPHFKNDVNSVITSSMEFDIDFPIMSQQQETHQSTGSDGTLTIGQSKPGAESVENEKIEITSSKSAFGGNLFDDISDDTKKLISDYFVRTLPSLFEMASMVKQFTKTKFSFQTIDEHNIIVPISQTYLTFVDILIYLLMAKNENLRESLSKWNTVFEILIEDMLSYPNNSFLMNKILKIFEIVLFDDYYECLRACWTPQFTFLFQKLTKYVDLKQYINIDNKNLTHKSLASINYAYVIRLMNYLYVSIRKLMNDEQCTAELSCECNLNLSISNEEISVFETYLSLYLELAKKDLMANEIQSKDALKNVDEEMKIDLKKNFYDSDAFLFTTKKIIENSKKISQRLKEFDV